MKSIPKNNLKEAQVQIYEKIKKIALISLFSDDVLMDMLVLKGGNALNLVYKIASRASIDLDFSIKEKIESQNFQEINTRLEKTLNTNFNEYGYKIIDFKFYERPKIPQENNPEFWGGYRIEFKIIKKDLYNTKKIKKERLHVLAETIDNSQLKTFMIDISKYEFCDSKVETDYEGLRIYVYSPEMIVIEKIRAICQQMPEYMMQIKGKESGFSERARDFYDIYIIVTKLNINILKGENIFLLENIFAAKKVPLELLKKVHLKKDFHMLGYSSLKATIDANEQIKEFSFYFDFVIELINGIINLLDKKLSI